MNPIFTIGAVAVVSVIIITLVALLQIKKERRNSYSIGFDTAMHSAAISRDASSERYANLESNYRQRTEAFETFKTEAATAIRRANLDVERLQAENTELQKEVDRLQRAIALLQSAPPFPEYITLRDITTIEQMAEKLRIAAPALHATQQFAASKEADRLANSAKRLADKLRPALIAAAAPVTPAQDAAA